MTLGADNLIPFPRLRRRIVLTLWLLLLAATGCGASAASSPEVATDAVVLDASEPTVAPTASAVTPSPSSAPSSAQPQPAPPQTSPAAAPAPTATPHPIAVADTELPSAPIGFESLQAEQAGPVPVSLAIESLGIAGADVIAVGVNPDLTFEVPPADEVGWYRFGPSPGQSGSAVLAAHIAFDGVDGVFRYLSDVEVGAIVDIGFDDGTTQRYRIDEVTEYLKDELPDSLFARTGDAQLALITCGGTFNRQLSSYESNIVAVATPLS